MIYAQAFRRINFNFSPVLEERVVAIFEFDGTPDDSNIGAFEGAKYGALREQYPIWICPYNQSNPAPNNFEKFRHGWSSWLPDGGYRVLGPAS